VVPEVAVLLDIVCLFVDDLTYFSLVWEQKGEGEKSLLALTIPENSSKKG
jgi:hypothetical protein